MMETKKLHRWHKATETNKLNMLHNLLAMVDDYLAPNSGALNLNQDDEIDFAIRLIGKLSRDRVVELYAKQIEDYVYKLVLLETDLDFESGDLPLASACFYYDQAAQAMGEISWLKKWPQAA